jgi:ribonuclease P protein subunit RPR2
VEKVTRFKREVDKDVASERVEILLGLAKRTHAQDEDLSQRYVDLARNIVTRSKVKIPVQYKRMICKRCGRFMIPGLGSMVRLRQRREPHLVITCLNCHGVYRIPLKRRMNDVKGSTKD